MAAGVAQNDAAYEAFRRNLADQADAESYLDDVNTAGTLSVTIIGCRGLMDKEKIGNVNPYALLQFGLYPEQKSPVLKKTLNPEWNQTFNFEVNCHGKTAFFVYIFGKRKVKKDRFLGLVKFKYRELIENPVVSNKWYTLGKRGDKSRVSGDLCLSYTYRKH